MPAPKLSGPVFTIRFTEGLADRHRLPLDHVIRVLNEVQGLIKDVGRRVQRERGDANPDGDFGLELLAGFRRGSVQADLVFTRNLAIAAVVGGQILETIRQLSSTPPRRGTKASTKAKANTYDPRVVARLDNIGTVQKADRTKTVLSLRTGEIGKRATKAILDTKAVKAARALREPNFTLEDLTVYGKLRELRDKYDDDEDARKAFYGELLTDDGTVWRVEFKPRDGAEAAALFRKQVFVTGVATYYKALTPKIEAVRFGVDKHRDYEAAFDELFGSDPELSGIDLQTLLNER
jgi:hypothetical protein